jgi:hypothetical protein
VCAYKESFFDEDTSGARFQMHRFACRRFLSRVARYQLDTGELAERVDQQVFSLVSSGERLMRV